MEYSLLSRDAEEQGQIDGCREFGLAMMAYAVLGRGMLSAEVPKVEEMAADDVRAQLPRFEQRQCRENLRLRLALEDIAHRKNATLAQLSIAWPMARGARAGAFIVPIPGAKSRKHLKENVGAGDIVLTADDLAEIDGIVPPGAASGTPRRMASGRNDGRRVTGRRGWNDTRWPAVGAGSGGGSRPIAEYAGIFTVECPSAPLS
jgi:aryl-alcohol dehydrogenase-like predicted oxidoreductase